MSQYQNYGKKNSYNYSKRCFKRLCVLKRFFGSQQNQPRVELQRVLSVNQEDTTRDENRFFDQHIPQYQFDQKTNTLSLIPFKVEFFKQEILFNKIFCFDIDSDQDNIYILIKLEFLHESQALGSRSPNNYDTSYNEYVCINNLNNPSVMTYTTAFSEIHYLKARFILLLDGEKFQQKYQKTYQEVLDMCKDGLFLVQLLHRNLMKYINQPLKQIYVLTQKGIENKYETDNDVILSQQVDETLELLTDTVQITEVRPENQEQDLDQKEQNDEQNTSQLDVDDLNVESTLEETQQIKQSQQQPYQIVPSNNLQQVYFCNKMLVKQPQIYEIGVTRQAITLQQLQQYSDYSKEQIEFLYQTYTENFINCTKNMSRALSLTQTGKADVYFIVHGYKGTKYDLQFFTKILQNKVENMGSQMVVFALDYRDAKNTNFYELGNVLYRQLKQQLIQQFGKNWLNIIKTINFIGFSQGNIAIESLITHFPVDLLIKLNIFVSLNGPILGVKKAQRLTQIGQNFIKQFGNKNENYCIRQLENIPEPRSAVQEYQLNVPYIQPILDYQTTLEQPNGLTCMQQGKTATKESFQQIRYLDMLAFNTRLFYFKKILLFGSLYDGYVNFQSETALWDDLLQIKLNDIVYLRKYLLVNSKNKYDENGFIDKISNRCFHIQALNDRQSIELITDIVCKNMQ